MRAPLISGIVIALLLSILPTAQAQFAVGVSVTIEPPPLPVYTQPPIPDPGFIWVPGYWAWGEDDYYWVPGTWVQPPEVGLLWTPGWWGWDQGAFVFHEGYWGPQVGFYGGINYGYGYSGSGYDGGYWRDRQFYYNRSVTNISNTTNITNVYYRTVVNNTTENHVSFNGGEGGVTRQPTSEERAAARAKHAGPTGEQTRHVQLAAQNREQHASVNAGKPPVAATLKPAAFSGREVVAARAAGGPVHTVREQQRNPQPGNPQAIQRQREQEQRGAQAEQQQRAQAEQQQRAQAEQQQRAQAEQQQRAQAEQQQRAQAEQQQRAQAEQQQRAQAEQQQRAQAEQQRAQAAQQQRAQAAQQQRAQAEQQQRAQAEQQQRAQAEQQQRAQAEQQRRAAEQPPRNIREAQAPADKRSSNKAPSEEERSKQKKPPDENPR